MFITFLACKNYILKEFISNFLNNVFLLNPYYPNGTYKAHKDINK